MQFIFRCGSFSACANSFAGCDVHPVSVRARVRDHLERLIEESGIQGEIIHTPVADYPYRALYTRSAWLDLARWLAEEAADCKNVKASIAESFGHDSAMSRFALKVWHLGRSLEVRSRG